MGNDYHSADLDQFFSWPARRAYKLFTKLSFLDLRERGCMRFIRWGTTLTSIIDSYKPIKETHSKQGDIEASIIEKRDELGQICKRDFRKKDVWRGSYSLGLCMKIWCSTIAGS